MKITLYTTHCPQCSVLEKKLKQEDLTFDIVEGEDEIRKLGFLAAPILVVDDKPMTFKQACDWIDEEL